MPQFGEENETQMGLMGPRVQLMTNSPADRVVIMDSGPRFLLFSSLCCWKLSVCKVNFYVFSYRCTEILNLPSAARRLYNEKGKEIFALKDLQRDELVKTWI